MTHKSDYENTIYPIKIHKNKQYNDTKIKYEEEEEVPSMRKKKSIW